MLKLMLCIGCLDAVNVGAFSTHSSSNTVLVPTSMWLGFHGRMLLTPQISSTTPITALISTKSPITSFAVVHLNGTVDWMVAQRQALLAWTGHTLSVKPTVNRKMVSRKSCLLGIFIDW